jgi:hypothetical protein
MSNRPAARRGSIPMGAEAVRAEKAARRAERAAKAAAPRPMPDAGEGEGIIRSSWIGTAIFAVGAGVAAAVPDARLPVAVVDLTLFFGGIVVFFWAWATAAGRSREREITLWNLVLLEDIAPRRVRLALLGALAVEIAVALGTAWITAALAFGILVPMWGEAHCWLWGARYGAFGPRKTPVPPKDGKGRRADATTRQ